MLSDHLQRHIVTRLSDEGLIIDIFARDGAPLFVKGTDQPAPLLQEIAGVIAQVAGLALNQIAVEGHIRAHPVVLARNPVWDLSAARANRMRVLLEEGGLPGGRIDRVTGHADRKLAVRDPMSNRNNRLEVILLRR
jgi:chemotaxis protein MotB